MLYACSLLFALAGGVVAMPELASCSSACVAPYCQRTLRVIALSGEHRVIVIIIAPINYVHRRAKASPVGLLL